MKERTSDEVEATEYFQHQMDMLGRITMERVANMHILIAGVKGVGFEIAKCLSFAGAQRVTLLDDDLVRYEDLSTNFLLRESDLGKPKSKIVATRLMSLSPFADVRTLSGALTLDLLLNFHVVVFANSAFSREEIISYNEFCRSQTPPIGFVMAESKGLFGGVFTDFSTFQIEGLELSEFTVEKVDVLSREVFVKERDLRFFFQKGDRLVFRKENSIPLHEAFFIERFTSKSSFILKFTDKMELLTEVTHVKTSSTFSTCHKSLRETIICPSEIFYPGQEATHDRGKNLHWALQGLYSFRQEYGIIPESNNPEHIDEVARLAQRFLDMNEKIQSNDTSHEHTFILERDFVMDAVRCVSSEFQVVSSMIGGLATLSIMSFSGSIRPPSQLIYWDVVELAPKIKGLDGWSQFQISKHSKYNHMQSIFGKRIIEKIKKCNLLFVGMESSNCEILKNILCIGISSTSSICIAVHDSVRQSCLASQPFFHPKTVGEQKSGVLKEFLTSNYPSQQIRMLNTDPFCLNEVLWEATDIICTDALSLKVKLYLDEISCSMEKSLLICGWGEGREVTCSNYVPHLTSTFAETLIPISKIRPDAYTFDHLPNQYKIPSQDPAPHETLNHESIVRDCLRCFEELFLTSTKIAHEFFEELPRDITETKKYILNQCWLVFMKGSMDSNFENCLVEAIRCIEMLQHCFPSQLVAKVSMPHQTTDYGSLLSVVAMIIAESVGIEIPSIEDRRKLISGVVLNRHTEQVRASCSSHSPSHFLDSILVSDISIVSKAVSRVSPIQFELNHPNQLHLRFVMILANMVSAQFHYPQIKDVNAIRRICGEHPQFLPLSTVNGALATLQILRLVQEKPHQELKNYRFGFWTGFLDSNSPQLPYRIRSCPLEKLRGLPLRAIPEGFTRWSKVCVPGSPDLTLQNLINFLQKKYEVVVKSIRCKGVKIFCSDSLAKLKNEASLSLTKSIFDLFPDADHSKDFTATPNNLILLDVTAEDESGDVVFPPVLLRIM